MSRTLFFAKIVDKQEKTQYVGRRGKLFPIFGQSNGTPLECVLDQIYLLQ